MMMTAATHIEVRGANVHNLKNVDVDIPLHQFVAITGLSGSGKSSLAMGVLYEEGSRRYLEALATYTRRRLKQGSLADVKAVRHIPAALALKQRPSIPNERATVGTMSEVFNVVRLIFSRLGQPVCPNHHRLQPSLAISQAMSRTGEAMARITCPICHEQFYAPAAEDFAFNSAGACTQCHGTGMTKQLDESKLIADENLSLADGAIASWRLPGRSFMYKVAEQAGIDAHVPFKDLPEKDRQFVLNGPSKKFKMDLTSSTGRVFHDFNVLYENARDAVFNSQKSSKSARSQARINQFFNFKTCPVCHGTRLKPELLLQHAGGKDIAEVSNLPLGKLKAWYDAVVAALPEDMLPLAHQLTGELQDNLQPLLDLGLDYLTLARPGNTLSTGELQRIQLARTLRTETTGVLYVLDEPSIGLHPDNIRGLLAILRRLVAQGNSLVVVDHNIDVIKHADWIIEIGPGSGSKGGTVIAQGTPQTIGTDPNSLIAPYLQKTAQIITRSPQPLTDAQWLKITVGDYFNLHNVTAQFPCQRLTSVTGFSGAGKSSLVLGGVVPAIKNKHLPDYITEFAAPLTHVVSVDASPVGKNLRSTVATYTSIMDNLRKLYAAQPQAQKLHLTASAFSYNNKSGACPTCGGNGVITLDIQYLPDMQQPCPECHQTRYNQTVQQVKWHGRSIVDVLQLSVNQALPVFADEAAIERDLRLLQEVGLGYLKLGEATPSLSGGEAQRLKLVKHLHHQQKTTLFVFDEPTIGLHPHDVQVLLKVFAQLLKRGATIITITHDPLLMANADYLLDLGPRGGAAGGKVVAAGSVAEVLQTPTTITTKYLANFLKRKNED